MPITLSKDVTQRLQQSIRRYCQEELELEIGDLKASLFLDFFLKEIGPSVYNQAVADAQSYLRNSVADLENTCYVPEFGYWKKRQAKSG